MWALGAGWLCCGCLGLCHDGFLSVNLYLFLLKRAAPSPGGAGGECSFLAAKEKALRGCPAEGRAWPRGAGAAALRV